MQIGPNPPYSVITCILPPSVNQFFPEPDHLLDRPSAPAVRGALKEWVCHVASSRDYNTGRIIYLCLSFKEKDIRGHEKRDQGDAQGDMVLTFAYILRKLSLLFSVLMTV